MTEKQSAPQAEVHIVRKSNCIAVLRAGDVVGTFAGPNADAHAELFVSALTTPAQAEGENCHKCGGHRWIEEGDPELGGNKVPCSDCWNATPTSPTPAEAPAGQGEAEWRVSVADLILHLHQWQAAPAGEASIAAWDRLQQTINALATPLPAQVQPAEPDACGLEVMHASAVHKLWKECKAGRYDLVYFAWKVERIGWAKMRDAISAQVQPAEQVGEPDYQSTLGPQPGLVPGGYRQELIDWAAEQWHAQVAARPMVNIHRRSLDDVWRQVLRHLGVDDRARLGPTHDELRAQIGSKEWTEMQGKGETS